MAIEAVPLRDRTDFPEDLEEVVGGWRGVRHYLVSGTDDVTSAMLLASGLPRIGDAWSGSLPTLEVVKVGPGRHYGGATDGDGNGGHVRVPVYYETPSLEVLPFATRRTTVRVGRGSQTVMFGAATGGQVLNNGRGASRQVSEFEATYYAYPNQSDFLAVWAQIVTLADRVNSVAMVLPNLENTGNNLPLGIGQALYLGSETSNDRGILEVAHRFAIGFGFDFSWELEDKDGNGTGTILTAELYPSADLRPLVV